MIALDIGLHDVGLRRIVNRDDDAVVEQNLFGFMHILPAQRRVVGLLSRLYQIIIYNIIIAGIVIPICKHV